MTKIKIKKRHILYTHIAMNYLLFTTITILFIVQYQCYQISDVLSSGAQRYVDQRYHLSQAVSSFTVSDMTISKKNTRPLKDRNIVITSSSAQILPLVVNMALSLHVLNINTTTTSAIVEFIIVVYDSISINHCEKLMLPCWYPKDLLKEWKIVNNGLYSDYGSDLFKQRTLVLTRIIHSLLKAGANVLSCDADVVLLKEPFQYFDQLATSFDFYISGNSLDNLNTGYYFVKSSKFTIHLFDEMLTKCKDNDMDDQKCLNTLLQHTPTSYSDRVKFLPSADFPTTGCIWGNLKPTLQAQAYVFHASCQLGLQKKLIFFRKHRMIGIECMRFHMERRLEQRGMFQLILNRTMTDLMNTANQSSGLSDFMMRIYSNKSAW
jgi:hypothetical protein